MMQQIGLEKQEAMQANEQEQANKKSIQEEKNRTDNPWERVLDNCEMDPKMYAGDKDVSRMRQVMQARKADLSKK